MDNKKFIKLLITGVVLLVAGSIIGSHADSLIKIILVVAGLGVLVDGIYTLANIKKWQFTDTTKKLSLAKAYESIALGAAAIVIAIFLNAAITVMVYIFAAGLLFSAVVSFQNATVAKKFNNEESGKKFLTKAIIYLLLSILLFFKPVESLMTVAKLIGMIIIIVGALIVAFAVILKLKGKKKEEDNTIEVEVVEEK